MNRINPLYLGLFLVTMLLFLSFLLSSAKEELSQTKEAYRDSLKLSSELSGLKKVYAKKMKLSLLKSPSLVQKTTKSGVTLSSDAMDIRELNTLMGKLLNGAYNITILKINRLSQTKASLYLEIKW